MSLDLNKYKNSYIGKSYYQILNVLSQSFINSRSNGQNTITMIEMQYKPFAFQEDYFMLFRQMTN